MTIKHVSVTIKAVINGKEITKSAGVDMHDERGMDPMNHLNAIPQSEFEDVVKTVEALVKGLGR